MLRVAAIILGVFLPFAANGQSITLENFRHPKNETERKVLQWYLGGVRDGLTLSSALASTDKLFCIPENLALTVDQAEDIMESWAKKRTNIDDQMLVATALLAGLRETFPCPK
jgi:Rap1a immunity proteins